MLTPLIQLIMFQGFPWPKRRTSDKYWGFLANIQAILFIRPSVCKCDCISSRYVNFDSKLELRNSRPCPSVRDWYCIPSETSGACYVVVFTLCTYLNTRKRWLPIWQRQRERYNRESNSRQNDALLSWPNLEPKCWTNGKDPVPDDKIKQNVKGLEYLKAG